MDLRTDIRIDPAQVAGLEQRLGSLQRFLPLIMQRALNEGAQQARTIAKKEGQQATGLKAGLIGKRLWMRRATRNLWKSDVLAGKIGWPLVEKYFQMRPTRAGAQAKVGKRWVMYPESFIQRSSKGGIIGIFQRKTAARRPIYLVRTSETLTEALMVRGARDRMVAKADEVVRHRLEVETDMALAGTGYWRFTRGG